MFFYLKISKIKKYDKYLDVVCDTPHASMNGLVPLVGWSIAQVLCLLFLDPSNNKNLFCVPVTFNNPLKVYYYNLNTPDTNCKSIFLTEKPVFCDFLKIIGVQI